MALAEFRAKWLEDKKLHHYNVDLHGETVTYVQSGSHAAFSNGFTFGFKVADGNRDINVHIVDIGNLEVENVDTETRVEQITVKALKDPLLGIDKPCPGDMIIRRSPWDTDGRPYYYTGDDENQGPDDWRLTFERRRRQAEGVSE